MPEKIAEYKVVDFNDDLEAIKIATKIMYFVGTPEGIKYALDPVRAVVWIVGKRQLYVSNGAIQAASLIGINITPSGSSTHDKLSKERELLLGDSMDWEP